MASPTATPPISPVPPVRPPAPRSVAGPIVLIGIGILFLLSTMRVLRWNDMGHWFAQYWPLLLILWGIIKLAEYYQAQRSGTRPAGIGVGGVFLVVFLVLFGITATNLTRVNWGAIRDNIDVDDNDFPFFGHSYTYEDQLTQDFPAGASLRIENARGAVNVTVSESNKISVSVHKRINAENQEDANTWNGKTKPQITVSGNVVSLNANTEGAGEHWVASDLDVSVPRKVPVVLSTHRGDVSVLGREADVEVNSQRGDVTTTDIKGKVSLSLDRSSARISQITGDVSIDGRGNVNEVRLDDIKGAVRLNGEFLDSVRLSKITKTVNFKSSRTDLELAKLDGELELDSGDLHASNLMGPVRLLTRSKDIRLDGVSGDVRLEDENGAVELRMTKMGSMQVQNRSADIQIYLPDKASFQLNARTRNGDVQSDFSEVKISSGNDQTTATGSVGSGGPNVVLSNEHGSIEIRKGSLAMSSPPSPPKPPRPGSSKDDDDSPETSDN